MKLKTTLALAIAGVLASAAGAFAIPVSHGSSTIGTDPATLGAANGATFASAQDPSGARITAGDTLLVDARLGHASLAKAKNGETYLFAQVTADEKATTATQSAPMNLALVIDRSGSMKGDRIANAMNAAVGALERMRDGDSVTVVSFDQLAQVVVPPTRVSAQNRSSIEGSIRSIRLGGDTCISCGLDEAMKQLSLTTLGSDRVNRMILLSDGATNSGIRDMSGMRAMAGRMRDKGVTISTIGVDVDFDEKMMAAIAQEANGKHHFVANASSLPDVFAKEFDDVLASVANEAELTIDLAPGVEVAEVFDRSFRREGQKLVIPFGTFSAKQEKTVLVKLRVPTDKEGSENVADVKLAFRDLVKKSDSSAKGSLALWVKGDGSEQKDLDPFVAARLERSRTAQTLTDANKLFESGRIAEARAKLATRKSEIARSEAQNVAIASASPVDAAPRRASKSLDKDFQDQAGAVAAADEAFAPPPPSKAGPSGGGFARPPAAAPSTREGKASVRSNQEKAVNLAF
jgi:Ca-activated chloride channel family protein